MAKEAMAIDLNKPFLSLFSILCLSLVLLVLPLCTPVSANPSIIKVGFPGGGYATIQSAINKSDPGGMIVVNNGTYYERVSVDKPVSIVGVNRDTTIIDAGGGGSGISITASNVNIQGFTIRNGGSEPFDAGITVSSGNNVISHNRITNNGGDGITVAYGAGNNLITGNMISSNSNYGIAIYATGDNVITNNVISSNSNYGINLYISAGNTLYHNFLNNTRQVSSISDNTWDYRGEGNYWSDYKGQDQDGDGIGDTPYFLGAYKDNYPLMGMFSQFEVSIKAGTFSVAIISNSTVSGFSFEVGAETGNRLIRYNATGKDSTLGFSRIRIPAALMTDPFVVIVDEQEIAPKMLPVSNATFAYLYFTYAQSVQTVTILTSDALHLYNELLAAHLRLQTDLNNLNMSYGDLLNKNAMILSNYTRLQESYQDLNNSYQSHLHDDADNARNLRNLTYIIAATAAVFIITTIYLSRSVHPISRQKISTFSSDKDKSKGIS